MTCGLDEVVDAELDRMIDNAAEVLLSVKEIEAVDKNKEPMELSDGKTAEGR